MITKFARLEFELFTKPSRSDFVRDHHISAINFKACRFRMNRKKFEKKPYGNIRIH
jgi:hypothetical protein